MNFSLKNGEHFYQWDKGRVLIVHDADVDEVHFTNNALAETIEKNVYEINGVRMVDVPDELLQHGCSLTAYACKCEGDEREITQIREEFKVISRKRPYNEQGETT